MEHIHIETYENTQLKPWERRRFDTGEVKQDFTMRTHCFLNVNGA